MSEFLITLVHATARVKPSEAFPQGWREAARAWYERCDNPDQVQYLLACHVSRWDDLLTHPTPGEPCWPNLEVVQNAGRDCCVDQCNSCMSRVQGKLIVGVQDDMFPPQGWDTLILNHFRAQDGSLADLDRDAVLHVSSGKLMADGWQLPARNDELYNPQVMTSARMKRLGYGGYPEYVSMFVDDEFSEHARLDGVVIDAREIVFEHRHPLFGGKIDEVYNLENNVDAYRFGHELLLRRRVAGFPPVGVLPPAESVPKLPKLVVCLPGGMFSARWVAWWDAFRCFLSAFYDVKPIWATSTSVYVARNLLAREALKENPDYVLWVDDDNTIEPGQFMMLWEDLRDHARFGFVAGWCWTAPDGFRAQKGVPSCGWWDRHGNVVPITYEGMMDGDGDLLDLDWSGFPCVLMPRATLETLGPNPFRAILSDAHPFGMLSEDTSFCRRVTEAGLRVVVDRRVRIPHLKLSEVEPVDNPVDAAEKPGLVKRVGKKVLEMMGA